MDFYLWEWFYDLDDLVYCLIWELMGCEYGFGVDELFQDVIIVGWNMGVVEFLDYGCDWICGFVFEEGGLISYVMIVVWVLGILIVGFVDDIVGMVDGGDEIIVDGDIGEVYL